MASNPKSSVYFLTGSLDTQVTGGVLIDREMLGALRQEYRVIVIHPGPVPNRRSGKFPTLVGLIANLWECFRIFPRGSAVFVSHGVYRDTFLVAYLWRLLWKVKIIFIVYHFDYNLKAPGFQIVIEMVNG